MSNVFTTREKYKELEDLIEKILNTHGYKEIKPKSKSLRLEIFMLIVDIAEQAYLKNRRDE